MSVSVIVMAGRQHVVDVPYRTAITAWVQGRASGNMVEFPMHDSEYLTADPNAIVAIWGKDEQQEAREEKELRAEEEMGDTGSGD